MRGLNRMGASTALAALACSAFAAGLLLLRNQPFRLMALSDLGILLFAVVAAAACGLTARRESGRRSVVMALWSVHAALFALGQIAWTWFQLSGRQEIPFPSLADVFYLAQLPVMIAAVFTMAGPSADKLRRFSAVVEGALTAGAVLFACWVIFLEDAVRAQVQSSEFVQALSLAYPMGMGVAAAALIIIGRSRTHRSDPRLLLLSAYALWMTATNSVYSWTSAIGSYQTGVLLDAAWPVGFSLLALAAIAPAGSGRLRAADRSARATFIRAMTPIAATLVALVLATAILADGQLPGLFELWTGLVITALMLIRQGLALGENLRLNGSLEQTVLRRTAELRASRQRYRSVIDSIGEIVFIIDATGAVSFVNNAWEKVTGRRVDDVIGTPMLALLHPDDHELAGSVGERLLSGTAPDAIEIRLLAADGSVRWVDSRAAPQFDEDGLLSGWAGTMVDVTVRRQAEESARESEGRWRLVLESSGEGMYGIGLDGVCTFINAIASEMLLYQPGELIGRNIHAAVHHSHHDGSPYPAADCPLLASVSRGMGMRTDSEWLWRSDGVPIPVELSSHPIMKDGEITGAVVTFTDITVRRAAQAEIRHRSLHDGLTGLPNRTLITEQLQTTLTADAQTQRFSALLIMDLDRFKDINDTFGHPVGDTVLQEVARRMIGPGLLRIADSVGRLGGDEFAVVLSGLTSPEEAVRVGEKIVEAVSQPIAADGHEFQVGCSIGVAVAPLHGNEPTLMLQRADVALYVAKGGEQSVSMYTPEADNARVERLELISELRTALDHDQLVLHYQPIMELQTGALSRLEALIRWNHPVHGLIWPDTFVPLAEQAGVIMPLTSWALRDALRQSRLWRSEGMSVPIAVNISAQTLHDPRLQATVEEWYAGPTPPGPLELEITESAVLTDPDAAVVLLSRFVAMGVRIAIDDFGTGYSSLAQLKRLPVHSVKIDKSFVAEMVTDARDASIVQTVIALGQTLGLEVVAEGVETFESAEHLLRLGCDYAQGWYFGEAQPAADITAVLLSGEDSVTRDAFDAR